MKSKGSFEKVIAGQRVVASLRRIDDLGEVLNHKKIKTIFILNTNIFELKRITNEVNKNGKKVFVHVDLVEGLGKDTTGIRFLSKAIGVDGIISTKSTLIKAAKDEGLVTVQRFFMVDSEAVKTGIKMAKVGKPDALEIMPAFLPKYYLDQVIEELGVPVIAGGLMRTEEDAEMVLNAGFRAITTSRRALWNLD
ncbi:glycerol uptake operon antiterminator [Desulfitispora alkaliphila]|uniref:glycerol-3-phosphate responsive antiterminator n=1 Tax=Desulfitispora alkaliphila TaxID=622674 RepID=UPI003D208258